ncbi:hypothetical protein MKK68_27860 [Methylobacterium sp. E-016]|uniref:hypothetical protein n=1 Tax=unclassified Methylobacterium TaxID=2615210 RepID=UPI0011C91F40|nr:MULTISPECIES: hypothetical protein [unclassified Methylobacterium]MCJ2079400.1 hypothetical protein [Methylobacterium sp. E-016]TXM95591.1 hypothetical protein FV223_00570 [Methylobacterium sp. WL116]
MIPYRVSVLAPNADDDRSHKVMVFGTYADTDGEALRTVSGAMPDGWRVDRIAGLLSRAEVEQLRLAHGEVREVSSFTIDGLLTPEDALYASQERSRPEAR